MKKELINSVKQKFRELFNTPEVVVFSPGRINLIGEHTDYNEGYTFPAAINKGIALAISKSNDQNSTVFALDRDESHTFSLTEIAAQKKGAWLNYILGVISELQKNEILIGDFNLVFSGNIPVGAGMSSSAALENSVVFALNELFHLNLSKKC